MANVPHLEAGPPKKKKKPSVNPVGVNRHNMKANTHFPGTGVSFKGEVKPTFSKLGENLAGVVLLPVYAGAVAYGVAEYGMKRAANRISERWNKPLIGLFNKASEAPYIGTWDDRNVKNNGTKLNPKDMLTGFMDK